MKNERKYEKKKVSHKSGLPKKPVFQGMAITKWETGKGLPDVENMVNVVNKGRKCNVYYVKTGKETGYENVSDSENQISVSGIFSEMVIDMTI